MRVAAIVVVLIIHVALFILFATLRSTLPRSEAEEEAPSMAFFLPPDEVDTTATGAPQPLQTALPPHPASPKRAVPAAGQSPGAIVRPEPQPPSNAISVPPATDWRHEMQIAANNELEGEERKRHKPSLLAPHDFSQVRAGSTDYSKPQFGWSHAATHRVEEIPTGGLLINLNDRCSIVWVMFPFPFCKVGKIPVRGDLFQHMEGPTAPGEP
jgi:hypothetical protein